jgi:serine/threonine protein phosphatase PrpC
MNRLISYSTKTTAGPKLQVNEDDVDVNLVHDMYMIFDGFGGSGIGDTTVKFLKGKVTEFYSSTSSDPDSTLPFFFSPKYSLEINVLINSVQNAHTEYLKENSSRSISQRGGASMIVALLNNSILSFVSIGNCLALAKRGEKIVRVVKPDTLYDNLLNDDFDASKNFPLSAFGLYENLELNYTELKVEAGDQVLLCSDGIYSHINLNEINYILSKSNLSNSEKVGELIDLANARGNWDNQSAVLLHF